ncbi:MBL fold metallo-hydrolase [Agriterribacter sp.]|uniref:MBL fold metallo-hydrolase n=1 Tax=Agriterribacter sp. TaxID=2821509 RepID=UPI002B65F4CD|nr:MBL fold metallo-hydrolase [Agriterribacter sp.]HRO48059.1 MBL fold metallo-hydrolase [Agriterribacter sp.]HRQ17258.1 MBL fold metallo-hydrolase [Agriterribacter sp.]
MKLYSINTGYFKLDGGAMFGVVPKSIWNKLNPADENNLCTWAMRCLLIEDGNRLILTDTGIGNKQDAKFFSHYYLHGDDTLDKSLARHGFHRNDITDVLLTHLHFDHVGGAIVVEKNKMAPAFKNATYWSNEQHWQWAIKPNDREKASFLKENIQPIQDSGKLKFIEIREDIAFSDNVTIRFVNGHTHAMMLPQINNYNGRTLVYVADLLPSVGHIPIPYVMAYDMFPLTTLQEKKAFLQEALQNNFTLFFEHDPLYECCTLQMTERGIRMKEVFKLEEIG